MSDFSEETFGSDGGKTTHSIFDREAGRKIDLSPESRTHGFVAGQRVRFTDECYELIAGREATVLGFSSDGRVWTQLDGFDGAMWTLDEQVPDFLEQLPTPETE